jgi:hypothetical protein
MGWFPALRISHVSTAAGAAFWASGFLPSPAMQFAEKHPIRHSEERGDEESLFLLEIIQEGFLASLGMTLLDAFFRKLHSRSSRNKKLGFRHF